MRTSKSNLLGLKMVTNLVLDIHQLKETKQMLRDGAHGPSNDNSSTLRIVRYFGSVNVRGRFGIVKDCCQVVL